MWTNTHAHTDAKRPNVLLEYKHTQTRTHIHMEPGAEADTMPDGSCYMACAMDRVTVVIECHTQLWFCGGNPAQHCSCAQRSQHFNWGVVKTRSDLRSKRRWLIKMCCGKGRSISKVMKNVISKPRYTPCFPNDRIKLYRVARSKLDAFDSVWEVFTARPCAYSLIKSCQFISMFVNSYLCRVCVVSSLVNFVWVRILQTQITSLILCQILSVLFAEVFFVKFYIYNTLSYFFYHK